VLTPPRVPSAQNVEGPRCHFFHSFFANNLYKDTGYKYGQVQRWTRPKKLKSTGQASASVLDCDRIIMPVHQGVHWVCAVIDLAQRKFVYYDSLGVSGTVRRPARVRPRPRYPITLRACRVRTASA
jgi:Ulp1 family protease